jgi:hypothetical protein
MNDTELPDEATPNVVFIDILDTADSGIIVELRYHDLQELIDVITKGAIELGLTQRVWCTGKQTKK